jgi:hypothetical protein
MKPISLTAITTETQALEIPNVLGELEDKIEVLGTYIDTLEERLKSVLKPYKDEPEPDITGATPLYSTNLGIRIDRSVTSVQNANAKLQTILDLIQV